MREHLLLEYLYILVGHSEETRVLKILGRDLILTRTCGKVAFSTFAKLCMEVISNFY